ncbi:MAG: Mov34/MPN/PAD-1 family protein [Motiliproteus sp.]
MSAVPDHPMVFTLNDQLVKVAGPVLDLWTEHRQSRSSDKEQFGVVIGTEEKTDCVYLIEEITLPCQSDSATRFSFSMVDPEHQVVVDRLFVQSGNRLGYLGTWHTHPESDPTPSAIDLKDWKLCMQRNPDRALFFFIVGTRSIAAFLGSDGCIEKMTVKSFENE